VHCLIVNVARARLVQSANSKGARADTIGLLLVAHEVLDGCDDVLLHGNDGLVKQSARKVGVVGEPFPVAASANDSSETAANGSKSYVGAFALELSSKVIFRLVDEFLVPGGTEMEARWVAIHTIGVTDAVAVVNQAKTREAESWDTTGDTRASGS